MHRSVPNFEWAPGTKMNDELEDEPEKVLTIADYEPGQNTYRR